MRKIEKHRMRKNIDAYDLDFCSGDVDADPKETLVRQASAVLREWLPAHRVTAQTDVFFDENEERVLARRRLLYDDLVLEEKHASLPAPEEVTRVLVEAARTRLPRVLPEAQSAAGSFLLRLHWLRQFMPDLQLPAFDDEALHLGDARLLLP